VVARFTDMSPEEQEKAWDELLTKARDVIDRAKIIEGQAEEAVEAEQFAASLIIMSIVMSAVMSPCCQPLVVG
jgi:hypothetical protein